MAVERGRLHANLLRDLLNGDGRIGKHGLGALDLGRSHRRLAPTTPPQGPRLGKSGMGSLQGQLALELGDCREDVKDEPPSWAGGVDRLGEHAKADLALREIFGRLDKLPH